MNKEFLIFNCFMENDNYLFNKRNLLNEGKLKKKFEKIKIINKKYIFEFPKKDLVGFLIKNISISNLNLINKIEFIVGGEIQDIYYKDCQLGLKFINDINDHIIPIYINKIGFPIINDTKLIIYPIEETEIVIKYQVYKCKGDYINTPWGTRIYGKSNIDYMNENIIFKQNLIDVLNNYVDSIDLDKELIYYFILVGDVELENKIKIIINKDQEILIPKIKSIGNNHIYGFASDFYDHKNIINLTQCSHSILCLPLFKSLKVFTITSKFVQFINTE